MAGLAAFLEGGSAAVPGSAIFGPVKAVSGAAARSAADDPVLAASAAAMNGCTECAPGNAPRADGACVPQSVLDAAAGAKGASLAAALAATKCDGSQRCLVKRAAARVGVADRTAAVMGLKHPGPADTNSPLTNKDIDMTLARWRRAFPRFCPVGFALMNFNDYASSLRDFDPAKARAAGADTIGCVLNTDKYGGSGKHWVCVFVDMRAPAAGARPWTVEYYNSTANKPPKSAAQWLTTTRNRLEAARAAEAGQPAPAPGGRSPGGVAEVLSRTAPEQRENTECGLFALHYIFARLRGATIEELRAHTLSDAKMRGFRSAVFGQPGADCA
jgi:hypothetical protein